MVSILLYHRTTYSQKRRSCPRSHALTDWLKRTLAEMLPNSCTNLYYQRNFPYLCIACCYNLEVNQVQIENVKLALTFGLVSHQQGGRVSDTNVKPSDFFKNFFPKLQNWPLNKAFFVVVRFAKMSREKTTTLTNFHVKMPKKICTHS